MNHILNTTRLLAMLSLITGLTMTEAHADLKLKENERIVFLGDSITQAGARPGGYVTLIREAIEQSHPALNCEVIGAGISGHKVPDCQKRLKRDVLDRDPTLVVIYIGINDVWHSTRDAGTSEEDFGAGLRDMIAQIKAKGARVILCTPSVIGEKTDGSNSLDEMLNTYAGISRKIAAETESELLDLRKLFLHELEQSNPEQKPHSILTTDGVHLNEVGNHFVAKCVLESFGVVPKNRLLRHIVMFKFKDSSSQEEVSEVVAAFAALPDKIDSIHDFEMGTNNSPEDLNDGFTHCFTVTFKTEADRAAYLPHPAHEAFVEVLKPHLDKVMVFDYWAEQ